MEGEVAITVIATGFPLGKVEEELEAATAATSGGRLPERTIGEAIRANAARQQQEVVREVRYLHYNLICTGTYMDLIT